MPEIDVSRAERPGTTGHGRGTPERIRGLPSIVFGRSSKLGEAAQPVKLTPAGQYLGADRNRARGGQVDPALWRFHADAVGDPGYREALDAARGPVSG
jgi:hypothetical protein